MEKSAKLRLYKTLKSPGKDKCFGTENNGKPLLGVTWAQTCQSGLEMH